MKDVLVIKTEVMLSQATMAHYQQLFTEQLKSGVVLIPALFKAEILSCPDDVEVIVESASPSAVFLEKNFNLPQ